MALTLAPDVAKQLQSIVNNPGLASSAMGQQLVRQIVGSIIGNSVSDDVLTDSNINLNVLSPQIITTDVQGQQQAQAQKQKQSACCDCGCGKHKNKKKKCCDKGYFRYGITCGGKCGSKNKKNKYGYYS